MNCVRAIDLMIDALVEPLDNQRMEELRQHCAECEACAAEAAEYRQLWQRMETVAIPKPAPGGLERLYEEMRTEFGDEYGSARHGRRRLLAAPVSLVQRIAAAFVLLGIGAILAIGIEGYRGDTGSADAQTDNRSRYLFIMTETQEEPELAAQVQGEVQDWFAGLVDQGIMESGIGLTDGPPVGTPPNGTLLNGPVIGFIVIRAADSQEARRIAVTSPIIDYGGFIEIRAMGGDGSDQ